MIRGTMPGMKEGTVMGHEGVGVVEEDAAILLSDIFPIGYFRADLAGIKHGDTVAVFGCGPVGLFAIASAGPYGAGRIIAVDRVESRLEAAKTQGAEIINFDKESPPEVFRDLTGGIGVDRVIDAVGVDAVRPHRHMDEQTEEAFNREAHEAAPKANPHDGHWIPDDAPSQALRWGIEAAAKAGTLAIIGVYPQQIESFPIGQAFMKNLTVRMGNCNHRRYVPDLVNKVKSDVVDPRDVLTQKEPFVSAIEAYENSTGASPAG